jgi:hypothetical protein
MTHAENERRWRKKNPDYLRAAAAKYREAHREERRKAFQAWRKSIREEIPLSPRMEALFERLKFE